VDGTNTHLNLRGPVIVLILAATAVPIELRQPGALGNSILLTDVLANVAGYIPVGIVLSLLSPVRAILLGAAISLFAESSQLVMMHRDPSVVDVVANVTGTVAGVAMAAWWKPPQHIRLRRWMSPAAALLAVALVATVGATAGADLNPRGVTVPGTLEAHWMFDEPGGDAVLDSSPHDLRGTARGPGRLPGARGGALAFDGVDDYIDFGRTVPRLTGSLSVSAWINARRHPVDDAAVVSNVRHLGTRKGDLYAAGFQLDTTIDQGQRTIGFKMGDVCGNLVMRYGATALQLDTWYHVAGVYDARVRTLDVYLDGQPDNGFLRGMVPGARRSARQPLYIGRRSDYDGFEFAGVIDDVRIYSRALSRDEVVADMGLPGAAPSGHPDTRQRDKTLIPYAVEPQCAWVAEPEDARLPAIVAAVGALACVAALGLWRWSRGTVLGLAAGAAGGLLLYCVAAPTLPPFNAWCFPLTSLAAAISVVASVRQEARDA
jgi:hypothetical protein